MWELGTPALAIDLPAPFLNRVATGFLSDGRLVAIFGGWSAGGPFVEPLDTWPGSTENSRS